MTYELKGTFCTYFETDYVRLDDFPTLESDWGRLLHHLTKADALLRYGDGEEDTLRSMLENHVLTVLCDIARKKLSNYGNSFANVQGTAMQAAYVQKLRQDINRWIARLDNYLYSTWQTGNNNSPAAETARWLKERLEQSLSADELDGNNNYYRMLRTVTAIQENVDYYLNQIKDSGDMNPALSLLIVYLKNYGSIAEAFNRRLATLPELYRKDILHAVPQDAVQDSVYVTITSSNHSSPTLSNYTDNLFILTCSHNRMKMITHQYPHINFLTFLRLIFAFNRICNPTLFIFITLLWIAIPNTHGYQITNPPRRTFNATKRPQYLKSRTHYCTFRLRIRYYPY